MPTPNNGDTPAMTSHEATITDLQADLGALSSPTVTALKRQGTIRTGGAVTRLFDVLAEWLG